MKYKNKLPDKDPDVDKRVALSGMSECLHYFSSSLISTNRPREPFEF
jgi:hypothetical protein